ncbi:hypothetical protein BDA96_01G192700 [Sorghum bicolor]|uniref:Uncharacterized protein n=1 Tax=Sorghum bicolor TaxID=4558 RepID=A0A921RZM2_SORBI|nr:hypothetical protein BDA96_01G192700 [Sorghum bicolor]
MPAVPLSSHSPVVKSMAPSSLPLFANSGHYFANQDQNQRSK